MPGLMKTLGGNRLTCLPLYLMAALSYACAASTSLVTARTKSCQRALLRSLEAGGTCGQLQNICSIPIKSAEVQIFVAMDSPYPGLPAALLVVPSDSSVLTLTPDAHQGRSCTCQHDLHQQTSNFQGWLKQTVG